MLSRSGKEAYGKMINKKRGVARILVALLLVLVMVPSALADGIAAYINCATKVYATPSTKSMSLNVPKNTPCWITAMQGGWAQVYRDGVTAYLPLKHLNLAQRMKGYISQSTKIYIEASTSSYSAGPLGVNTEVYVIGVDGGFWRVQDASGKITGYVPTNCVSNQRVKESAPSVDPRDYVVAMDWFNGGSSVLKKNEYGTIYDIESGLFIRVKRMGGSNHADIEPATKEDTLKLWQALDGKASWDSRPVILIAGGKYVACAINGVPHGDQTILDNGFEGQICLHMVNSKTHGSDKVNEEHQKAIVAAYQWAHSR